MSDQRMPPVVPTTIIDAAERAITEVGTDDPATEPTLHEVIRAMLAIVLPMYELRLGAEIGSLTFACRHHKAPEVGPDCIGCARYLALIGARRVIEGRGGYASARRRAALQEADDGTG
jgi:hypothetical protein